MNGNWLPENMVSECELTGGQAGKCSSLLLQNLAYDFLEI